MRGVLFEVALLALVAVGSTAMNAGLQALAMGDGMPEVLSWLVTAIVPAVLFVVLIACEVRTWRAVVDVCGGSEAVDATTKVVLGVALWLVGGVPQAVLTIMQGIDAGLDVAALQVPILQVLVPVALMVVAWFRLRDRRA